MINYKIITLNPLGMLGKEMREDAYLASWPWPLRLRLPCWIRSQDRLGSLPEENGYCYSHFGKDI